MTAAAAAPLPDRIPQPAPKVARPRAPRWSVVRFMVSLIKRDIALVSQGGKLYVWPGSWLTAEDRAAIEQHYLARVRRLDWRQRKGKAKTLRPGGRDRRLVGQCGVNQNPDSPRVGPYPTGGAGTLPR